MGPIRALFWGLGAIGALFTAFRILRLGVWLLMRPGGWAIIVFGTLLALKTLEPGTPAAQHLAELSGEVGQEASARAGDLKRLAPVAGAIAGSLIQSPDRSVLRQAQSPATEPADAIQTATREAVIAEVSGAAPGMSPRPPDNPRLH